MAIIIGSTALKHHFPDFPREPKDIDIISGTISSPTTRVEVLDNPVLVEWLGDVEFCPIDELYTLKVSHSLWDLGYGSWEKHIFDIQYLKERGAMFIKPLFDRLYTFWEGLHGKRKTSDLDMTAEEFFNNAIDCPIHHDTIHEMLITHPYFQGQEKPTYTKILKPGAEVDVCMDKFEGLPFEDKCNLVFEEVAVMQYERYPSLYWKHGYEVMLKKFILHHAKLEEAIWIIQNYKHLILNIPFNSQKFINELPKN